MNLYPAALVRIKRIERALKLELAALQRPLARLIARRSDRGFLLLHLMYLHTKMHAAIVASGKKAYAQGWTVAAQRLHRDQVRFDDKAPAEPEAPDFPPQWASWYDQSLDGYLQNYTSRLQREIGQAVTQAAVEGWTIDQLTAKLQQVGDGLLTWQAERLARTETMRLWNMGHYARFEQEPADTLIGYEYSVVMDDRTSHICHGIEGLKVRREELELVPPLHPHCRTILQPVYSFDEGVAFGEPTTVKPLRGFGVIPPLPLGF